MKKLNIKITDYGTNLIASIYDGRELLFSCDTTESNKGCVYSGVSRDWVAFDKNIKNVSFYFDLDNSMIVYCVAGDPAFYFDVSSIELPTIDAIKEGETLLLTGLPEKE